MNAILSRGADLAATDTLPLTREQSHHLANVLRLKAGAKLLVLNGEGASREAGLASVSKKQCVCEFRGGVRTLPRPEVGITLFQCVAKPAGMDWLIEKATELAVSRIVPVLSERTVAGANVGRWTRIAEAAICQCGGGWLPEIADAVKWGEALARIRGHIADGGAVFTGALTPGAPTLAARMPPRSPVAFIIGPEGDLTPTEYAEAETAGARPVTFGPQVLRVETAAIFAVCAAKTLAEFHKEKPRP